MPNNSFQPTYFPPRPYGKPLAVTVSIGVAEPTPNLTKPEQVFTRAEQALLRAKQAGRNEVRTSP